MRLRGDAYSDEARDAWRDLLERESAERPVFAFAKHEGVPAGDPFAGRRPGPVAGGGDDGALEARRIQSSAGSLVKIILPEGLWSTLVTSTVTSLPTAERPPSTTIIVPSWR